MGRKARSISVATKRDMARRSSGLRPDVTVVVEVAMVTVTVDPGEVGDMGLARGRARVTGRLPVTVPGAVLPPTGCSVTQINSI